MALSNAQKITNLKKAIKTYQDAIDSGNLNNSQIESYQAFIDKFNEQIAEYTREGNSIPDDVDTGGSNNNTGSNNDSSGDNDAYETKILKKNGQVVDGLIIDGKTYYADSNGNIGSRIQNGDYVEAIDGKVYKMINGSGKLQNGSFNSIVETYNNMNDGGSDDDDDSYNGHVDGDTYDPDRPDPGVNAGNDKGYIFDNSQDGKLFVIDANTFKVVDTITPDNIKDNVDTIMAGYGINPDQEDLPDWVRVGLREDDTGGTTGKDGEDGYTDDGYVDLSDSTRWITDNKPGTNEELGIADPDSIGDITKEEIESIIENKNIDASGRPELMDGGTLADMFGVTNDRSEIEQILLNAANAKNDYALAQQSVNEDRFYDDLANVQNTVLDTLGVNKLNAIQSGASKGMTAANELSAILGLEQTAMAGTNQLAADRKLLADQAAMDQEAAIMNALAQSNTTGLKLGETASNILNADMVGYGSELNYDSALRSILGNIEAQRIASNAQLGSARINADGSIKASLNNASAGAGYDGYYEQMKKMGFTDKQIKEMYMDQVYPNRKKVDPKVDGNGNDASQNMNDTNDSDDPFAGMPGYGSSKYD